MSENKSLSEIINFRIEKLNKIKESKIKSFPYNFKYSCKIIELIKNQKDWTDKEFKICGRIISMRKMGKASFINFSISFKSIAIFMFPYIFLANCYLIKLSPQLILLSCHQ